jgi:hypothetical protein
MEPESENRDLVHVEASSRPKNETDADIAPLIQKVGATSIAEIEKLIRQLQETKNFLQSETDRIERETARYMNLTQMASASVRIIFDTVSGWRQAGHPMREFEIMRSQGQGQHRSHGTPHRLRAETQDFVLTGRSRPNGRCKGEPRSSRPCRKEKPRLGGA